MFQDPYMYNINGNGGNQFLSSYPEGTLLGGNNVYPSRPRPVYNVMPHHNLPTYGMDINSISYGNNSNNETIKKAAIKEIINNDEKKINNMIKDILNSKNEGKSNNIIIIIM